MPGKISAPLSNLGNWVRNNKATKLLTQPSVSAPQALTLERNTLLKVEAATAGLYKVSLPDGEKGFISSSAVTSASSPVRKSSLKTSQSLLDEPNDFAAKKATLPAGASINILANYKDFYFVKNSDTEEGWISKKAL